MRADSRQQTPTAARAIPLDVVSQFLLHSKEDPVLVSAQGLGDCHVFQHDGSFTSFGRALEVRTAKAEAQSLLTTCSDLQDRGNSVTNHELACPSHHDRRTCVRFRVHTCDQSLRQFMRVVHHFGSTTLNQRSDRACEQIARRLVVADKSDEFDERGVVRFLQMQEKIHHAIDKVRRSGHLTFQRHTFVDRFTIVHPWTTEHHLDAFALDACLDQLPVCIVNSVVAPRVAESENHQVLERAWVTEDPVLPRPGFPDEFDEGERRLIPEQVEFLPHALDRCLVHFSTRPPKFAQHGCCLSALSGTVRMK